VAIFPGDALDQLRQMEDESVHCVEAEAPRLKRTQPRSIFPVLFFFLGLAIYFAVLAAGAVSLIRWLF
jgi:hypothetical protein